MAGAGSAKGANVGPDSGKSCIGCAAAALGFDSNALSASITHLRSMFAFRPCASATAAIDTPAHMHSWITAALNSAL